MLKKLYSLAFIFSCLFLFGSGLYAQTTVTGKVTDSETGEELIGVNILVKGTVVGTISELDGSFEVKTYQELPFTIVFSQIGMETKEVEVTEAGQEFEVQLGTQAILADEIVVSASRVEEKILESPVTIEKLDLIAIREASSADYYDELAKLKGVHSNQASITFNTINTRGFATAGNTRFVQLMDGMDNAAPLLNFPTGNVVGISELDIANVELVPGAASALYGPNAFNGILLMNSKNPFDYQGLSAMVKYGYSVSDRINTFSTEKMGDKISDPFSKIAVRWAQKIGGRFAYKLNFSVLSAKDWLSDDYTTDRNLLAAAGEDLDADVESSIAERPNFDGLNTYGDETQIFLPFNSPQLSEPLIANLAPIFAMDPNIGSIPVATVLLGSIIPNLDPIQVTRTGIRESDLLDNRNAQSIKLGGAMHYRLSDKIEASFSYQYGSGSSVYQGAERYALRNFVQQFYKLEFRGADFFLRGYGTQTGAGDSYNMTAMGAFSNEAFSPSATEWVPTYAGTYAALLSQIVLSHPDFQTVGPLPIIEQLTGNQKSEAHMAARAMADAVIPQPGTDEFNRVVEQVRNGLFQRGGASFIDDSRLWHVEGNYDLASLINAENVDFQVGGNFRRYSLFTDGTVYNEDPDGSGVNERIYIDEWGAYVQGSVRLLDDRLKLTASGRWDKNENFEGRLTPRGSIVFSLGEDRQHNIRASFQTGFRNPSTQAQYIYFPTTNVIVGGTEANAARYGIYENGAGSETGQGAWSKSSVDQYQGAVLMGADPNDPATLALLEDVYLEFVKPENLKSVEVGYKGLIANKLLVDLHGYYNSYHDFIFERLVVNKAPTSHKGMVIPGGPFDGQIWSAYTNAPDAISSIGAAIGLTFRFSSKLDISGNYSYADFSLEEENPDFNSGFNTPNNRFTIGFNARRIAKRFGIGASYRWQEEFYYESSFGEGMMPSYDIIDANISVRIPEIRSIIKIGGTNLVGDDYRTNVGNPFIGQMYYIAITYDQFMQ